MSRAPTQQDRGYSARTWAKCSDRAAYLAQARRCYPKASDEQIEDFARTLSTLDAGFKTFIPDSQVEAEELAVQFGFQREPHTSLIHLGEAA